MEILLGVVTGFVAFLAIYCLLGGVYTVDQNERAVVTSFGKAERIGNQTTLALPQAEVLNAEEKERYVYPQVRVVQPGGPYLRLPWQRIYKVSMSIQTINVALDPDMPEANSNAASLEAVTKDQLNIGLTGQVRYKVSEQNLYAYLFGVKKPISHVMGYFISILRERIATYEAPVVEGEVTALEKPTESLARAGVSINDLRKNLNDLNHQVDIITSAAERQAAAEFARARSVRPQLVGQALREIGQDRDVLDAVFETLEVDRIIKGGAEVTLIPAGNNETLMSLLASGLELRGGPGDRPASVAVPHPPQPAS